MSRIRLGSWKGSGLLRPLAVVSALLVAAVPVATHAQAGSVAVTLSEFRVSVDRNASPAGNVVFNVHNGGQFGHELVVIKSDLNQVSLPMDGNRVAESQVQVIGRTTTIAKDAPDQITAFNLAAGRYVLICNLPNHYARGMTVSFLVGGATPPPAGTPAPSTSTAAGATQAATPAAPKTGNADLLQGGTGAALLLGLLASAAVATGAARVVTGRRAR